MKIEEILQENEFAEDVFYRIIKFHQWDNGAPSKINICFFLEAILILLTFSLYKWSSVDNLVFISLFIIEFILLIPIIDSGIFLTAKYNNLVKLSICFNRRKDKHIISTLDDVDEENIEDSANDMIKILKEIFKEMNDIIPDMRSEIDKILLKEKRMTTLWKLILVVSLISIGILIKTVNQARDLNDFFIQVYIAFIAGMILILTAFCIGWNMEEKELKKNDLRE